MKPRVPWNAFTTVVALLGFVSARPVDGADKYSFVAQWGSAGSAPGSFSSPFGIVVDKSFNVYVADAGNNRIQKFNSMGNLLTYWGTAGAGAGQLNFPQGIAVDALNNVYTTDTNNHRIQKFSASGAYLRQWGQHGSADGYFDYPTGVAADPFLFGSVWTTEPLVLSDSSNHRIQRFTDTGAFTSKWPGLISPQDVAIDRAGIVFVLDDNTVVKYSTSGTPIAQWGSEGTGAGQFDLPAGLCVDASGSVYVADTGNHRIQKFTNTGAFVAQWGSFGTGPGQFRFPADVAVDDSGSVYVSDQLNARIQKFRTRRVLLVHGICGDANVWGQFAQVLTDSGFVVDRLQYGDTKTSLRPAAYVKTLASKLDSIGIGPISVVAHSMGGLITREYLRRQTASGLPNRISQLITLGTPHHGSDLLAWALNQGRSLDQGCTKLFHVPCRVFDVVTPVLGCLGNSASRPALLDMLPGARFLNRLNYAANAASYDTAGSKGWAVHASETGLASGVYYATIAGTGSLCSSGLRENVWGNGTNYHQNDGTAATGSALMTNGTVFRAQDVDLPTSGPVTHNHNVMTLCNPAYYESQLIARKVARILATSPTSPPVGAPAGAAPVGALAVEAAPAPADSLQMVPALQDSVPAGQLVTKSFVLPATSVFTATLVSTDAHLSLQDPNGAVITPNDTSTVNGVSFFSPGSPGLEGFEIANPVAGTWSLRVDATSSVVQQRYGCIPSYATSAVPQLRVRSSVVFPGDSIRVRGTVRDGNSLRADLTWSCSVIGPDSVALTLTLFDDGAHGDSLAGDGVYGAIVAPNAGLGSYQILGSAVVPGRGEFVAGSDCEFAATQDLSVHPSDITLSHNPPLAGDSLTIFATIHNNSSMAALGVGVEIRDLQGNTLVSASSVDIPASSAVTIQTPWVVSAPDSHTIQVQVSPYVLDEPNYANNVASLFIILGQPLSAPPQSPGGVGVQLYAPHPNPTSSGVVIKFQLPRPNEARVGIFDVLGRRVRDWQWPVLPPGTHILEWDGRDGSGVPVHPGVYLCRLEVDGRILQQKVILVH